MSSVSSPKEKVDSLRVDQHLSSPKSSNIFFSSLLPTPPCDSPHSLPAQPSPPSMLTSYEQYLKSSLLSKMYLQQYISNNITKPFPQPNQTTEEHKTEFASTHSNGDNSQMKQISKERHVFLDGPLDLSTRQTNHISKDSLAQSLQERFYSPKLSFPSFSPMFMKTPPVQSRSHEK